MAVYALYSCPTQVANELYGLSLTGGRPKKCKPRQTCLTAGLTTLCRGLVSTEGLQAGMCFALSTENYRYKSGLYKISI